jgi:glucosyl-3-phosphoglycerate synthase
MSSAPRRAIARSLESVTSDNRPLTLEFDDVDLDATRRRMAEVSIAVIIPARNEATTISRVLGEVGVLGDLVDELVVVDDHSSDDTAVVARRAGATVVSPAAPEGKGAAMAVGLAATSSEIVVFLDGDVESPTTEFVPRLVAPLLAHDRVELVKGFYRRPLHDRATGGGRVNELTARPILSILFADLAHVRQPLAGETAARRSALDAVSLAPAYGVEIALLIDVARKFGPSSIAQVDLGVRRHRNRPLEELRPMAVEVLRAALDRALVDPRAETD